MICRCGISGRLHRLGKAEYNTVSSNLTTGSKMSIIVRRPGWLSGDSTRFVFGNHRGFESLTRLQMIRIENKKTYKGDGIYVGRPSPLGNPFELTPKTSRAQAIAQYREWLLERLQTVNPTSKAFMILVDHYRKEGELTLICWCAVTYEKPDPPFSQCHCEVIREFVLEMDRHMAAGEIDCQQTK
jgi:hypothetical protein